ncbi:hypothetical protein Mal52_55120 [Symmachiella dynata]|uniref:Uncharacterized protein n=1 Tax=Symmachiella dynata TaxID=2527995 RepID=A0A517ZWY0_9PLAN|nr:hypothetical protein Mal52_55120 [Symmachiella dynata]
MRTCGRLYRPNYRGSFITTTKSTKYTKKLKKMKWQATPGGPERFSFGAAQPQEHLRRSAVKVEATPADFVGPQRIFVSHPGAVICALLARFQ